MCITKRTMAQSHTKRETIRNEAGKTPTEKSSSNEYVELDLYGRGFDGIFGKNAELLSKRHALFNQLLWRERKSAHIGNKYVDLDVYGRADPRIFGEDSQHISANSAAVFMRRRGLRDGSGKTSLRALLFPKEKLRHFLTFSSEESVTDSVSEALKEEHEGGAGTTRAGQTPDTPKRVKSELPSQERRPLVSPGTVSRFVRDFNSDESLGNKRKLHKLFQEPSAEGSEQSDGNRSSGSPTSGGSSEKTETSHESRSSSPHASDVEISEKSTTTSSSIENVDTHYIDLVHDYPNVEQGSSSRSFLDQSANDTSSSSSKSSYFQGGNLREQIGIECESSNTSCSNHQSHSGKESRSTEEETNIASNPKYDEYSTQGNSETEGLNSSSSSSSAKGNPSMKNSNDLGSVHSGKSIPSSTSSETGLPHQSGGSIAATGSTSSSKSQQSYHCRDDLSKGTTSLSEESSSSSTEISKGTRSEGLSETDKSRSEQWCSSPIPELARSADEDRQDVNTDSKAQSSRDGGSLLESGVKTQADGTQVDDGNGTKTSTASEETTNPNRSTSSSSASHSVVADGNLGPNRPISSSNTSKASQPLEIVSGGHTESTDRYQPSTNSSDLETGHSFSDSNFEVAASARSRESNSRRTDELSSDIKKCSHSTESGRNGSSLNLSEKKSSRDSTGSSEVPLKNSEQSKSEDDTESRSKSGSMNHDDADAEEAQEGCDLSRTEGALDSDSTGTNHGSAVNKSIGESSYGERLGAASDGNRDDAGRNEGEDNETEITIGLHEQESGHLSRYGSESIAVELSGASFDMTGSIAQVDSADLVRSEANSALVGEGSNQLDYEELERFIDDGYVAEEAIDGLSYGDCDEDYKDALNGMESGTEASPVDSDYSQEAGSSSEVVSSSSEGSGGESGSTEKSGGLSSDPIVSTDESSGQMGQGEGRSTESSSYSQVFESTVVDEDEEDDSDTFLMALSNPLDEEEKK